MPANLMHRHYAAIADVLADARELAESREMRKVLYSSAAHEAVSDIGNRLIRLFGDDNPNFDRTRFLAAAVRDPKMHGRDRVR